jgi:solute carrier family 35 protein F5
MVTKVAFLYSSVSGNTAVFQSQAAFVFVLSAFILKETVTPVKVMSVLLCVSGVILVSLFHGNDEHSSDSSKEEIHPSVWGYVSCIVAMMTFVVYEVGYKKSAYQPDDPVPVSNALRMLGLMGITTFTCYWPIFLILHGTGYETFEFPTGSNLRLTIINLVLDGTYNCLLLISVSVSSPLFTTVGMLLVLPATVPTDYFLHDHYTLPPVAYGGVALITIGFLGFCWAEYQSTKAQRPVDVRLLEDGGESGTCNGSTHALLGTTN